MSQGSAIALVVTLVGGGSALLWWLASRQQRRAREAAAKRGEAFEHRLRRPELAALSARLGHNLPASFEALHADHDLVRGDDWLIGVPNPIQGESECYVAWFEPADLETLESAPPDCEGLLPFADDGSGDCYLIDPRQTDPEVIYFSHESGSCDAIGVLLSEFVALARRPVPDE